MNRQPNSATGRIERIVHDWLIDYERETVSENGDPEAFVERVRSLAEAAEPASDTHRALAAFLERLDYERA